MNYQDYSTQPMKIALCDLTATGDNRLKPLRDADHRYWLPTQSGAISKTFANFLAWAHPPIVYGPQNEVVVNIRVFHIMVAVYGEQSDKVIPVRKFKSSNLSKAEVDEIACTDVALSTTAFSIRDAAPTLFAFCRNFEKYGLTSLNLLETMTIRAMAKVFSISPNTLQKVVRRKKR